jgi:hypothetical protein
MYCPVCVEFDVKDLEILLVDVSKFREKRRMEHHAFVMDIHLYLYREPVRHI